MKKIFKTSHKKIKRFLRLLGPGFIAGAAGDDPSGIATYSQTGAQFGYQQLWAAPFTYPFMVVVQEMSGRIGIITGKGLAGVIRKYYPAQVLYVSVFFLFVANTINIGANLGAMASSAQLLLNIPFFPLLIGFTILIIILEIFVPYKKYARLLKYLALSLFAYIGVAFIVNEDWGLVLRSTIFPTITLSKGYLLNIVAILGTTISPYLYFWQANQEVEEEVADHKLRAMGEGIPKVGRFDIRNMRIDTAIGMSFSNIVMFFIIMSTAATLNRAGIFDITTASQAAEALRPIAGDFGFFLFAGGIIGTGMLTIPILAGSASYALSESFGWREGLSRKFTQARNFYLIIVLAIVIGFFVNFIAIPPFKMLYYTAVINGVISPPLLFMIMKISNNKKIMGEHTNSRFSNIAGWTITLIMSIASLVFLISLFF